MSHPLLFSTLSKPTVLRPPTIHSCVSNIKSTVILFAPGLILCCASGLSLLCGLLPSHPSAPPARNQQAALPGTQGFPGTLDFQCENWDSPGKPSKSVILHAIFIISLVHIFSYSTNTFYKLITDWQLTWRGYVVPSSTVADLLKNYPLCFIHCSVNLFPLGGGLCCYLF